jgi:Fe-S-cluster-containing dehydrogenase component
VGGVLGAAALSSVPGIVKTFAANEGSSGVSVADISESKAHYWRFGVDIKKCIGCGSCARACKKENDVPLEPEANRTWVERYVITDNDHTFVDSPNGGYDGFKADYMNLKYKDLDINKTFFVPKLCNHCDKPPCVAVCPVGATYATKEGVVLINRHACIGCRYCVQACPYGARFFDRRLKVVDKCTWCYHRISKGLQPACVEACPTGARVFGDTRDPDSKISKLIKQETLSILKPELGCENKVYYVGMEKGVY